MNKKPKSEFNDYKNKTKQQPCGENIVWCIVLDNRYGAEVERTTTHKGFLNIFDLDNNGKLVSSNETNISYDAIFGPDINDVEKWKNDIINIVDNIK